MLFVYGLLAPLQVQLLAHRLPGYLRQGRCGSLSLTLDKAASLMQSGLFSWWLARLHRVHQGRPLDVRGSICTFVLYWRSSTKPLKRSEVETGLDGFSRRWTALNAVAGVAGALQISDNGVARSGMFETLWIQRLDQACQEAVSSRANMAAGAADLLPSRSMARDCCD